jgi:hypothetical protein|tara:strand:- start:3760 stop:4218 length:459 start_codon:yes stop_codon:yes gene_type:complete
MKTTTGNELYFVNYENLSRLAFQFVPMEVGEKREQSVSEHKVVGRNHPVLQSTGGKSTMSLAINLYGEDVAQRAKFFSQFTMRDELNSSPPRLKIVWAGLIPDNSLWVVKSASPVFSLFNPQDNFAPRMCIVSLDLIQWTPYNYSFNDVKLR